jgi:hypothetical protein
MQVAKLLGRGAHPDNVAQVIAVDRDEIGASTYAVPRYGAYLMSVWSDLDARLDPRSSLGMAFSWFNSQARQTLGNGMKSSSIAVSLQFESYSTVGGTPSPFPGDVILVYPGNFYSGDGEALEDATIVLKCTLANDAETSAVVRVNHAGILFEGIKLPVLRRI